MNLPLQTGAIQRGPRGFGGLRGTGRGGKVSPAGTIQCGGSNSCCPSGCQGNDVVYCDSETETCDPNACQCMAKT